MKPAREHGSCILEHEGVPYGVVLPGDFTAEHEFGIDGIKRSLGMSKNPFGFADRCIKKPYEGFAFSTGERTDTVYGEDESQFRSKGKKVKSKTATLVMEERLLWYMEDGRGAPARYRDDTQVIGCWSDSGFGVVGFDEAGIQIVELLAEGLRKGDFAVWLGGGDLNPFSRGGLVLAVPSLVPEEYKQITDAADFDYHNLQEKAEATGIKERLKAADRGFFACKAAWNERENGSKMRDDTAHEVVFYLNPMQQNDNNYGWFTVEELDQWCKGEGPIPKKKETV